MKSAEQIFEKFKQIFQGNETNLSTFSTTYEPPAHQRQGNTPLSPSDRKPGKAKMKNIEQPSKSKQQHRKYPPPMKPQTFPNASSSGSRAPSRRATSRVDHYEAVYSPSDDELHSDTSEFESSGDEAAGQHFSYEDQCVPEL